MNLYFRMPYLLPLMLDMINNPFYYCLHFLNDFIHLR
jgi:hypothetical protein